MVIWEKQIVSIIGFLNYFFQKGGSAYISWKPGAKAYNLVSLTANNFSLGTITQFFLILK